HRVRINDVVEKTFGSGNEGFEITLDVSGYGSKLWFYLVLDRSDTKKTNQRIGTFFESFGINDFDLSHYRGWIGKIGGVRVKHEEYQGENRAKVAFCLNRKNQEKLPAWKGDAPTATNTMASAPNFETVNINGGDWPF
ncbi:MAG: hypothetical protein II330_06200, partial [Clostridia bacterium]|nr:hypothetical protein [Clostridia bacterium]